MMPMLTTLPTLLIPKLSLLAISVTVDAQTVTAFFVGIVALLAAYDAIQSRKAAEAAKTAVALATETRTVIDDTKKVADETHQIVNSQRTAMQELIKKLEGENRELRAEADFTTTEKGTDQ